MSKMIDVSGSAELDSFSAIFVSCKFNRVVSPFSFPAIILVPEAIKTNKGVQDRGEQEVCSFSV